MNMQMQMQMANADVSKDANSVPGFPQDAFMESPAMAMDAAVAKPETYGLRPGWSGYMQGMMTLIRVLPPDQYDHIIKLRENQRTTKMPHGRFAMTHSSLRSLTPRIVCALALALSLANIAPRNPRQPPPSLSTNCNKWLSPIIPR